MPSTRTNLSPYDASGHWRGVKAVPSEAETTQRGLATALRANSPRSGVRHVVIALPSFSVGESLLEHYGDRIPSLEHRYLLAMTMLGRLESCELLFVCSVAPSEEVLEYYFSLIPADRRNDARARFHLLEVTDRSSRPVAAKLL